MVSIFWRDQKWSLFTGCFYTHGIYLANLDHEVVFADKMVYFSRWSLMQARLCVFFLGEDLYKLLPSLLCDPLLFIVVHVCM